MDIRGLTSGNWIKEVNRFDYDERKPISDLEFQIPEYASFIPYKLDYYQPIPLTEEWLLKFGFDSKGSDVVNEYEVNDAVFTIGDDEDCKVKFTRCWYGNVHLKYIQFYYGYTPITMIEYVHQLQNLYFALTGEELKINSEKTVNIEP